LDIVFNKQISSKKAAYSGRHIYDATGRRSDPEFLEDVSLSLSLPP
jgi:hypothetical protein